MVSCGLDMDYERPHDDAFRASSCEGHRPRIVLRLLAEGSVVVAMLGSLWWGMSILGAYARASESASPPVYVAGCSVGDMPQKGSAGGGCSKEGASHPITLRRPGAGLAEHAHGAEK